MRSMVLRLGVAGTLLLAAGAVQAGPAQTNPSNNQGFFQRLASDLFGPVQDLLGPAQTGQPDQSCGSDGATTRPGHSETSPGSAFNPDGTSGMVYAGEQARNSKNTASVSQYDVACANVTSNVTNKGR